ncbi:MAG: hypothetical protein JO080_13615 [Mucilaginibacter sp.]|nr:hypothetical protein [Mucilaginibacter sp.]
MSMPEFDKAGELKPRLTGTLPVPDGSLRRSASQAKLTRSNSVDRLDKPLEHDKRKRAREEDIKLGTGAMKDFSVIGVFSREAFENFGKAWKTVMSSDSLQRPTKVSKMDAKPTEISDRLGRLSSSTITTGFEDQVQALFENRTVPHVIAVIEGKKEQASFSLKTRVEDKPVGLSYTRTTFSQGLNAKGSIDDKQSMSFYVRDDMKAAYSFSEVSVEHGDEVIRSVAIDYKTQDGNMYRSLVVHIPNQFVGTGAKESTTHQAFEGYAKATAIQKNPVVVTGYLGDTNFQRPYFKDSVPSMGGHLSSGDALNPRGSGAQSKDTHFMQHVPVGEDQGGHSVMQPATLNYLFLKPDDVNREATDHPSMIAITAHGSEISGRDPAVLPDYYRTI